MRKEKTEPRTFRFSPKDIERMKWLAERFETTLVGAVRACVKKTYELERLK